MTEPWQSRGEYDRAMAKYGRALQSKVDIEQYRALLSRGDKATAEYGSVWYIDPQQSKVKLYLSLLSPPSMLHV